MQEQDKPKFIYKTLDSGAKLIRFDELHEIYKFDDYDFNPDGLGMRHQEPPEEYLKNRHILTPAKLKLIEESRRNLEHDKEFLELIYKAKSDKRKNELNKFGGSLSMAHYATGAEKIFKKGVPGAKKTTLDMAFQVGTFSGGNYGDGFSRILKTIMMCQAMNINVNIDVFDSDTRAINNGASYVICNVAKSHEKLNLKNVLASSHPEFFSITLFNGYSASECQRSIGTFLQTSRIKQDLGQMYDVIGGNMLENNLSDEGMAMVSKILKIGINGRGE